MKLKKIFFVISFFLFINIFSAEKSSAQCAMCKQNAEAEAKKNGAKGGGINVGILYLLIMPYALVGGIGYYWYYRNKKAKEAEQREEEIA